MILDRKITKVKPRLGHSLV